MVCPFLGSLPLGAAAGWAEASGGRTEPVAALGDMAPAAFLGSTGCSSRGTRRSPPRSPTRSYCGLVASCVSLAGALGAVGTIFVGVPSALITGGSLLLVAGLVQERKPYTPPARTRVRPGNAGMGLEAWHLRAGSY